MPAAIVYGLPNGMTEDELQTLYKDFVSVINSIGELTPYLEKFAFFFPPDRLKEGLGSEILVFIYGIPSVKATSHEAKDRLAKGLGEAVKNAVPDAGLVECYVILEGINPNTGFWSSAD